MELNMARLHTGEHGKPTTEVLPPCRRMSPVRQCMASQTAGLRARPTRSSSPWQSQRKACLFAVRASASSGDSQDSMPPAQSMTKEEAYKTLKVPEGASFDRVMSAKNKLMAGGGVDAESTMQIDLAYDILLMESMKRRMSGETEVARSVRFADVPQQTKKQKQQASSLPGGLRVGPPKDQQALITQSAVFAGLAAWTLAGALTAPPNIPGFADQAIPGLQLAIATGASIYFLRETKKASLGRAAGLSAAGFFLGSILGGILQSWLQVDIVPIGGLSSPGALVGEFAIIALYLTSTFLE